MISYFDIFEQKKREFKDFTNFYLVLLFNYKELLSLNKLLIKSFFEKILECSSFGNVELH
jgi:hypothetical protein